MGRRCSVIGNLLPVTLLILSAPFYTVSIRWAVPFLFLLGNDSDKNNNDNNNKNIQQGEPLEENRIHSSNYTTITRWLLSRPARDANTGSDIAPFLSSTVSRSGSLFFFFYRFFFPFPYGYYSKSTRFSDFSLVSETRHPITPAWPWKVLDSTYSCFFSIALRFSKTYAGWELPAVVDSAGDRLAWPSSATVFVAFSHIVFSRERRRVIRLTNIKTLVQFLIAAATLGVRRALTALPKCWLNGLREYLRAYGFPSGIIVTSLSGSFLWASLNLKSQSDYPRLKRRCEHVPLLASYPTCVAHISTIEAAANSATDHSAMVSAQL